MKHAEQIFRFLGRGFAFATILAAPWCLGGVYVSTQYLLGIGITLALAFALIAEILGASNRWKAPLIIWPIVAGLLVGVVQLMPMQEDTLASISQYASEWNAKLLAEDTDEDVRTVELLSLPAIENDRPISIYPSETRYGLAYFSLAAGAIIAGMCLFRTRSSLLVMLGVLGTNSFVLSLFAIVQKLTWNRAIFWCIPVAQKGSAGCLGPFVNRNNGAGYLLIGLGCMLAWLFYSLEKNGISHLRSGNTRYEGYRIGMIDRLSLVHAGHLTLFTMTGFIIGGILCSVSRGGILSMLCAGVTVSATIALLKRKVVLAAVMPTLLAIGVFLLFWIGWNVPLAERFELLFESDVMSEQDNARLMNWSDSLQVVPESPWLGSGLFTYRYAYRPYQEDYMRGEFYYAENIFVQTIVEAGTLGILFLLTAITMTLYSLCRLIRSDDGILCLIGLAGLFVITSQIICSCFDFGLYIPSNIMTLSLVVGGICTINANRPKDGDYEKPPRWRSTCGSACRFTVPLLGCVIALAASVELKNITMAKEVQDEVQPLIDAINNKMTEKEEEDAEDISDQDIQLGLDLLDKAILVRPDDARLHEQASVLLLEQYHRVDIGEPSTTLAIFYWTQLYHQVPLADQLETLQRDQAIRDYIYPAMRHAVLARRASPMLPNPHLLMAQLSGLNGSIDSYQRHAERSLLVVPSDPDLLFLTGALHYLAGNQELAFLNWRQSLSYSQHNLEKITLLADPEHTATIEQIDMLYPDSPKLLLSLARQAYRDNAVAQQYLLGRAFSSLDLDEQMPLEEKEYVRYTIRLMQNRPDEAIPHLQEALMISPSKTQWRYSLSILLRDQGRIEEAQKEAKRCVRAEPANKKYKDLLRELNRLELLRIDSDIKLD